MKMLLSEIVWLSRKSPRFKSKELVSGSPGITAQLLPLTGNPPQLVNKKGICFG